MKFDGEPSVPESTAAMAASIGLFNALVGIEMSRSE